MDRMTGASDLVVLNVKQDGDSLIFSVMLFDTCGVVIGNDIFLKLVLTFSR